MRGRRHRWLPTHLVSALHRSRPETGKYSALRKLQSRWQALPVVVKNLENGAPPPSWFDPQPSAYLAVPDGSFQRKSHVRNEGGDCPGWTTSCTFISTMPLASPIRTVNDCFDSIRPPIVWSQYLIPDGLKSLSQAS